MKKLFGVLTIVVSLLSAPVSAAGVVSGEIEYIRTQSFDKPASQKNLFWFTLKLDKAGSCKKWEGNGVLFFADDTAAYSMVLAAFTAGKSVAVHFDENQLRAGWCTALHVTLGNPPPLDY
ncbi:hypothetical protein [Vibrio hepatarius]|uniref:hypothetical protein n=1 Tax=Vibrio hepatarius TaxID=171383 RepID=UPI001C09DFAA|nr:hypothetical protein [Vibrio hepatarius]MBU2895316.1 hypothetical protein [Vibrio hepatarius]